MGACDDVVEVNQLVSSFYVIPYHERVTKNLYRDSGLTVFKNTSGLQAQKIKKDFQKVF